MKYLKRKGAAQRCRLTGNTPSEWTRSADTASEPRKTQPASFGKPPFPDGSAAKTGKEEEQRFSGGPHHVSSIVL